MSAPQITVLIDTYNYGRYIEEAIESVLQQDFPAGAMEILVVDDGSTDDTRARVSRYGDRVKYIWKENGGQASVFNCGLEQAQGELIFLLDADDYWLPGKVRRIVEEFAQRPEVGMVYHRFVEMDQESGVRKERTDHPVISGRVPERKRDLISYWIYPTSTLAFRRKTLESILPVPEGLRIQADAYLAGLAVFVGQVQGLEEPLSVYRVHGANLFHATGSGERRDGLEMRIATRQVLIEGVGAWLQSRGWETGSEPVRSYLAQWELAQEADRFEMAPPGRVRAFRHLLKYPQYYGEWMNWRHKAASYSEAIGALLLGYRRYGIVEELRLKIKRGDS